MTAVIHCDSPSERRPQGYPTIIGEDVLVGHMAMVHGTVIEDWGFVGLGAIVMDGCVIESEGMLAAGALLSPGKVIGKRQLWMGRPATYARDLTETALESMKAGIRGYVTNAANHKASLAGMADGAGEG